MFGIGRIALAVALCCSLLATTAVLAPDADAQTLFEDDRIDFGGTGNGEAFAVRAVGDQVWVGGTFSEAVDPDPASTHPRVNLAVFDFNTGEVLPWVLDTNGKVKAIASDDESTVWVAGNFTQIAGQDASYVAAIDAFTGEIVDSFTVVLDNETNALHYDQGWLYIGGEFAQVNGLPFTTLVRVDAFTGELDTNFQPNPDAQVHSIDVFGDLVYAGGEFEQVGTDPALFDRRWVAAFDSSTGQPAGPEFVLAPLNPGEASHRAGVLRLEISPGGDYLYTGDKRNRVTQWDLATGQQLWRRGARGDIQAVAADGASVYVGVHDGFLVSDDQRLLYALNEADGSSDDTFLPLQDSYWGTRQIHIAQGALIAAGDFETTKGLPSPRVAVFHGPDWAGATPLTRPPVVGDVNCDSTLDIGDALAVAQSTVGLRTEADTCDGMDPVGQIGPGGDVNNDGVIDIGDALLIARCSVGLSNVLCPTPGDPGDPGAPADPAAPGDPADPADPGDPVDPGG